MPTPIQFFKIVAYRHGISENADLSEIENFYKNQLPKLSKEDIEDIYNELMSKDGLEDYDLDSIDSVNEINKAPILSLDESPEYTG